MINCESIYAPNCLACCFGSLAPGNNDTATVVCKYLPGRFLSFSPSSEWHAVVMCMRECNDFRKSGFLFKSRIARINEMITIGQMPW